MARKRTISMSTLVNYGGRSSPIPPTPVLYRRYREWAIILALMKDRAERNWQGCQRKSHLPPFEQMSYLAARCRLVTNTVRVDIFHLLFVLNCQNSIARVDISPDLRYQVRLIL